MRVNPGRPWVGTTDGVVVYLLERQDHLQRPTIRSAVKACFPGTLRSWGRRRPVASASWGTASCVRALLSRITTRTLMGRHQASDTPEGLPK